MERRYAGLGLILFVVLSTTVFGANPSFSSFNTNDFSQGPQTQNGSTRINTNRFTPYFTNQATLWVDRNGNSASSDGTVLRPYKLLSAAIAAGSANQCIHVMRGTYDEGTNILILKQGMSILFESGARVLFTPSATANDNHSYCQIELTSDTYLSGPGIIVSTPTNSADSSEMIGFGKFAQNASNAVVDGLTLQGDAIAFRNLSTNTIFWKIQNCTTKTTDGFVQGVNGTSTLTSSNSLMEIYNNRIYLTNNTTITASVIRRAFVSGIYCGRILAVGNSVIRSDTGTTIPSEVFENKTFNVGRWLTNGYFFKDVSIDDSGVTNAVSYDYRIQAGNAFVLQNVVRIDGLPLVADPASSPVATSWLPTPNSGINVFGGTAPVLSELNADVSTGTNKFSIRNISGTPIVYWTDGSTVHSLDLSKLAKTNASDQSMSWGIVSTTNLTSVNLTTSNIIGSTLCIPSIVSNYVDGLGVGGSVVVSNVSATANSLFCQLVMVTGSSGTSINTNAFVLDFGRTITNVGVISQIQNPKGYPKAIANVSLSPDMTTVTRTNVTFNTGTALTVNQTNLYEVFILGQ